MLHPRPHLRTCLTLAAAVAMLASGVSHAGSPTVPSPTAPDEVKVVNAKSALKESPAEPFATDKAELTPEEKQAAADQEAAARSLIPEPAAAALGLLGLGMILFRRYRVG